MDSLNVSNQKFKNIIENLPSKWRDLSKEGFQGNEKVKKENIGYYIFEVNQKQAHLFFGGSEITHELLDILIDSLYTQTLEELYIGIFNVSHGNYDYEESVKILSKGFFPNLKIFSIGLYDELYNGGMNFTGKLGDVTVLLKKMPKIEELELLGYFEFKEKIDFLHLKKLTLWSDSDTKYWFPNLISNDISQNTLENFLLSNLPKLNYLDLFVDQDSIFQFPLAFLSTKTTPKLELINIEGGFLRGEEEKLLNSDLANRHNIITRIVFNER